MVKKYCWLGVFLIMWSCNVSDRSSNETVDPEDTVTEGIIAEPKWTCVEDEEGNYCMYKQYRTLLKLVEGEEEGGPSYTVLEKKVGATYQAIKPSELFILDESGLIRKINKSIYKIYTYVKVQFPEDECISALDIDDNYALDDFSLSFRKEGIFFAFSTGCKILQGKGFTIEWEEVDPFIK